MGHKGKEVGKKYRLLNNGLGEEDSRVLVASPKMLEEYKDDIPRWIKEGRIEWVEEQLKEDA